MYHLTKIASRCEEFKSTANDAPAVPSHDPPIQDPNYQRTAMAHACHTHIPKFQGFGCEIHLIRAKECLN